MREKCGRYVREAERDFERGSVGHSGQHRHGGNAPNTNRKSERRGARVCAAEGERYHQNPDQAKIVAGAYDQLIEETSNYILGLQNQLELVANKRNAGIEANRTAATELEVFDRI